jgi:hypothetical protein
LSKHIAGKVVLKNETAPGGSLRAMDPLRGLNRTAQSYPGEGPAVALIGTGTMALSQNIILPTNSFGVGRMRGYAERIHFIGIAGWDEWITEILLVME